MKKKNKKNRVPSFIVRTIPERFSFGNVVAFTEDKAIEIAKAQKLLYKGKYAIYKLHQIVR